MAKIKKIFKIVPFFIFFLLLFDLKLVVVTGNSMSPTLPNNSYALVDKYLFKLFKINQGDILLFRKDKEEVVKKIVGFPNSTINIEGKEIKLGENEIFILGENLPESIDSRTYGPLNIKNIIGKVVVNF